MLALARLLQILLACCVLVTLPRFSLSRGPPGYVYQYGEYTYKFVLARDDARTWQEAELICKVHERGHLASLTTRDEIQWATQTLLSITNDYNNLGRFWLGATDLRISSVYEFVDGLPFRKSVAPWASGEPDRPLDVNYHFCVVMNPRQGRGETTTWSDENCFNLYGYICKTFGIPLHMTGERKRYNWAFQTEFFSYKIIPLQDDHMSWSEADFYCKEAEKGRLLSYVDKTESDLVTKWLRRIRSFLGFRNYWIGASNLGHELSWEWSDDTQSLFKAWAKGEPSKNTPNSTEKHCATVNTYPLWGQWTTENCAYQLPFICKSKKCIGKTDLAFVVDASSRVTQAGFEQVKAFIWSVVNTFKVSNEDTRVAVIRYSSFSSVIFNFKKYADARLMRKAIYAMDWIEGGTRTDRALNQAMTQLFTGQGGDRPTVPNFLILLTNTKSENPRGVAFSAKALRDQANATIVAIGIGNQIDMRELRSVATTNNEVINVLSYRTLKGHVGQIREKICEEMIQSVLRKRAEEERRRNNQEDKTKTTTQPPV